jgi:hypothetical protein
MYLCHWHFVAGCSKIRSTASAAALGIPCQSMLLSFSRCRCRCHATAALLLLLLLLLPPSTEVYPMRTFSSYTPIDTVRCPGARTAPLNADITSDSMLRLNWLLNNFYNQQLGLTTSCTLPQDVPSGWYQSTQGTLAGTYGPITNVEMQAAVWVLTGVYAAGCGQVYNGRCIMAAECIVLRGAVPA